MLNLLPLILILVVCWKMQIQTGKGVIFHDYLSQENSRMIKGALALVILLHHLSQATMDEPAPLFQLFAHAGGILPIALFFFYSGYGLQKKYLTAPHYETHFLLNRIPAVLIPYLVVTCLSWLQSCLLGKPLSFYEVLQGFYNGWPIVRFSWFVLTLIIFYFVFYLLMRLCRKHYGGMIWGAVLYSIIWVLVCRRAQMPPFWYRSTHMLVLGMLWAYREESILKTVQKNGWPGILCMMLVFLIAAPVSHFGRRDFNEILVILFIFAVVPAFTKIKFCNPALRFLGSISYEIYILQGLVITALRNDLFYLENNFLFCVLSIAATLAIAYPFHLLFTFLLRQYRKLLSKLFSY